MILNDFGIVLWRRNIGEFDRTACILTRNSGKLMVRFGGVNRPAGKLKVLCEPITLNEYRLHFSRKTSVVRAVGGRLVSTFPRLRCDLNLTLRAMSCCEMSDAMIPERSPSPVKFRLLSEALEILDQGANPWVEAAYGLKLLDYAGLSLRELPIGRQHEELWRVLHEAPLDALCNLPSQERDYEHFLQIVYDHVEAHTEKALRCPAAARDLRSFAQERRRSFQSPAEVLSGGPAC